MKRSNGKTKQHKQTKKIVYRGIPINQSVDFSAESLQARRSAGMIYLK